MNVLVIEDEYFVADDLCRALRAEGMTVFGPAASGAQAREIIEGAQIDLAIVDLNLGGEQAHELVGWIYERGIAVTVVTGYDGEMLAALPEGVSVMQKPVATAALIALLR